MCLRPPFVIEGGIEPSDMVIDLLPECGWDRCEPERDPYLRSNQDRFDDSDALGHRQLVGEVRPRRLLSRPSHDEVDDLSGRRGDSSDHQT